MVDEPAWCFLGRVEGFEGDAIAGEQVSFVREEVTGMCDTLYGNGCAIADSAKLVDDELVEVVG